MLARVAQNTAAQSLAVLIQFADRFLVVGILLRAWGPQVYSEWVVLLSCVGLLSLGEFGLNIYYGNLMQKAWAAGNGLRFQRTVATALACSFAVALALGGLGFAVLVTIDVPQLLSVKILPHTEALAVIALIGAATLSRSARGSISQIFRGRQEYALGVAVDAFFPAALLVLTIALALLGYGPFTMAVAYLASDLFAGWGFMIWQLHKRYPDLVIAPMAPTWTELHDTAQHAKWLSVLNGAPIAWLQVPVVLLGHIGTAGSSIVSFVVLRTLVNFMRSLGIMVSMGSAVEIVAVHHAGQKAAVARHLRAVGSGLAVLTMAMAVGIFLFGPPFVAIWTGRSDLYNQAIVLSLLASAILAAPSVPIASHLMLANMPRPPAIALVSQIAIGLVACAVLAREHGAVGAAIGLAIGEAIGQAIVLPILAARYLEDFSYSRYLLHCVLAMGLATAWSVLVGIGVMALINTTSWLGLAVAGALWGLLGLIPPLALALPAHQREAWTRQVGVGLRAIGSSRSA